MKEEEKSNCKIKEYNKRGRRRKRSLRKRGMEKEKEMK